MDSFETLKELREIREGLDRIEVLLARLITMVGPAFTAKLACGSGRFDPGLHEGHDGDTPETCTACLAIKARKKATGKTEESVLIEGNVEIQKARETDPRATTFPA